jgi:hypothetical protein
MDTATVTFRPGTAQSPPTLADLPRLVGRFVPRYLRHLARQPYRNARPRDNPRGLLKDFSKRHHIAIYDASLEIMLKGYSELAGHPLLPHTGPAAVLLMRLGFAFDDEFERRAALGEPLSFEEVFERPAVQAPLLEWREFMSPFPEYESVREFLVSFVTALYKEYLSRPAGPGAALDFESLLKNAELDSGGLLVTLAHVVGRLNSAPPAGALLRQFASLGVTAKLADDMVDFRADVLGGRPNLLGVLAGQDEDERERVAEALAQRRRMTARWWRRNCPAAYRQLALVYQRHQAFITSRWLRYASTLMWTPALVGLSRPTDLRGRL